MRRRGAEAPRRGTAAARQEGGTDTRQRDITLSGINETSGSPLVANHVIVVYCCSLASWPALGSPRLVVLGLPELGF